MTIDLASFFLGVLALSLFSGALIGVMYLIDRWKAKKERERARDRLLAEVGIACIERPSDVRGN